MTDLAQLLKHGVLTALDVHFARAAARLAGCDDPLALLGAAMASRAPRYGHVCVDLAAVQRTVRVEPREDQARPELSWPSADSWRQALAASPLVGPGRGQPTPLVLQGGQLYLERYFRYQERLVRQLQWRGQQLARVLPDPLRQGLCRLYPATDDAEPELQRLATLMAVLRRLCVISGGPGTGKTHTLVRILALLVEQAAAAGAAPPRVALMAPTGKAAARMNEAVRQARGDQQRFDVTPATRAQIPQEASTIHRALGWRPRTPHRFAHHADNPLPADVVVVDEASMVPLTLISKLVDALPARARLILLGDRDQLASVEAGAVLGDICAVGATQARLSAGFAQQVEPLFGALPEAMVASGEVPAIQDCTIHLTRSRRFGQRSAIRAVADAVIAGHGDQTMALLRGGHDEIELIELTGASSVDAALRQTVVAAYGGLLGQRTPVAALAAMRAFRVLCAHRRGLLGAQAMNLRIRQWLAAASLVPVADRWYAGRPVLITENDYQLNLFNGDDGVVLPAAEDPDQLRVFFPEIDSEGVRSFHPARLPAHESVFAMTIHKSQGSEFDRVVVLLPEQSSPVLTRELLYTAITRARARVTVVGSEAVIRQGVMEHVWRASGIRARLWGEQGEGA